MHSNRIRDASNAQLSAALAFVLLFRATAAFARANLAVLVLHVIFSRQLIRGIVPRAVT